MPEPDGTARLDRIEKILEMFIADDERIRQEHEDFQEAFQRDLKQLLIAQVLQADEIDKLWKTVREHSVQIAEQAKRAEQERQEHLEQTKKLDERIDKLVIAIGEFIRSRSV